MRLAADRVGYWIVAYFYLLLFLGYQSLPLELAPRFDRPAYARS